MFRRSTELLRNVIVVAYNQYRSVSGDMNEVQSAVTEAAHDPALIHGA